MRLVIVGGGFSGVSMAVQTARYSPLPVHITVVEPAAHLGRGLAYGTDDPDHRINGAFYSHSVDPLDTGHGDRWAATVNLSATDPEIKTPTGLFPRRRDFARYLQQAFSDCAQENASGSQLTHHQARVTNLSHGSAGVELVAVDAAGQSSSLAADQVVLATGNPPPKLPAELAPFVDHPAMIGSPWQGAQLDDIDSNASVTVMGSSLTSVDALASLMRRGHQGPITVFSRRGLRPREQRPPETPPDPLPESWLVDRINGRLEPWLSAVLRKTPTVRAVLAALRQRTRDGEKAGEAWQVAFDELRDVVWQVWPQLPLAEQQRYLRQVRPWYDVHRFRLSPATEALVAPAIAAGQIRVVAGRLQHLQEATDSGRPGLNVHLDSANTADLSHYCDAFINCAGLDIMGEPAPGSLEATLLGKGILSRHPTGLGYQVDEHHRVLNQQAQADSRLRLIGPATAGRFGDPVGAMFIAVQINRLLPALFYSAVSGTH